MASVCMRVLLVIIILLITSSSPDAAYYSDKELIDSIYFPTSKLELDRKGKRTLDLVAEKIKSLDKAAENSGKRLIIRLEGYSDSVGDEEMNLFYSMLRASLVEEYLVEEKGVSFELYLTGFGETKVLTPERNAAERRNNRRVDIVRIIGGSESLKVFRLDKPADAKRAINAPARLKTPKIVTLVGQESASPVEQPLTIITPEKKEIIKTLTPEELNKNGVAKVRNGDYVGAISLFHRALEPDAGYVGARFNLAFTYQRMGRTEEAKQQYKKILEIKEMAKVHLMLGIIYEKEGSTDLAISEFENTLNIEPDNKTATTHLKRLKIDTEKEVAEKEVAEKEVAEKEVAEKVSAYNRGGAVLVKAGRYEEALVQFEMALKLDERNEGSNFNRAYALQKMGRLDEAVQGYMRILTVKETAKALFMLGIIYEKKKDFNNAVWFYEKALDKSPSNKRIQERLDKMNEELKSAEQLQAEGVALLQERRYSDALQKFEKAALKAPDNYKIYYNLGLTYLSSAEYDKAIEVLQKSIQIEDSVNAHVLSGIAYDRKADAESARKEFTIVLEMDPNNKKAKKYLMK